MDWLIRLLRSGFIWLVAPEFGYQVGLDVEEEVPIIVDFDDWLLMLKDLEGWKSWSNLCQQSNVMCQTSQKLGIGVYLHTCCPVLSSTLIYKSSSSVSTMAVLISSSVIVSIVNTLRMKGLIDGVWISSFELLSIYASMCSHIYWYRFRITFLRVLIYSSFLS